MKIIEVTSCQECPHHGLCGAWGKLTANERFAINYGVGMPVNFILAACHLKDAPSPVEDKK